MVCEMAAILSLGTGGDELIKQYQNTVNQWHFCLLCTSNSYSETWMKELLLNYVVF